MDRELFELPSYFDLMEQMRQGSYPNRTLFCSFAKMRQPSQAHRYGNAISAHVGLQLEYEEVCRVVVVHPLFNAY